MTKIKIRKKNKHLRAFEEDLKNDIVVKNKILKKKKQEKKKQKKKKIKKKNDLNKILNLANEQNEEYLHHNINDLDEENIQEANKFLEFDDDIHENSDVSFNESNKLDSHKDSYFNELDESNDIFQEFDIKANEEISREIEKKEKEDMIQKEQGDKIDPLVEKCYKTIGEDLAHFKKGKLHRAFKILTKSPRWFELLLLTKPKNWTTQATFEATKLFSSGLKEVDVCKFYEFILLPIILENIDQNKKLDSFLYKTLIKALYKSNAWFKGILFPLLQKECTKKQMIIIGSIIQKMSISINSVINGLNQIFKFQWNSTIGYFLSIFFNKKYSFPKQFIGNCVEYFINFQNYPNQLTVIWHKALLMLVNNYKELLDENQIDKLKILIQKKNHPQLSSEILKHMYSSSSLIKKIKDIASNNEENII
ncbi:U3/U14 snoRNA-associated small subunit rRNA processing protein, putative [Plasmodium relictum]|uniref:U3/U14 snoRNA-associated small subunit rRNA processing protein, putative n=1 Tax=Plasmodium relictum TaxID=85471 RepID=A0A1J1H952_PLARL|nr:U3/U14 snoRNA-associated small subunit rRNA processing protein, putative [Plasmodium relictum]CRG99968.1 U3/U14 snoRNA-associated small subunit rRNA processing protein, putative [Plasmodium relictum]